LEGGAVGVYKFNRAGADVRSTCFEEIALVGGGTWVQQIIIIQEAQILAASEGHAVIAGGVGMGHRYWLDVHTSITTKSRHGLLP
jgi:hypothetical protein